MTRALVINPSSSIATQSDSPHALGGELHKRRMDLLRELRGIPEIIQAAKELNADEVYKIVSFPDGGQLYKDAAGNFKGVFYKDGKILEHTKFQAVRPQSTQVNVFNIFAPLIYDVFAGEREILKGFPGDGKFVQRADCAAKNSAANNPGRHTDETCPILERNFYNLIYIIPAP